MLPTRCYARIVTSSFSKPPTNPTHSTLYGTISNTHFRFFITHHSNIIYNETHLLYHLTSGNFHHARQVLDKMPQRGNHPPVVAWTSLVSKFSKKGLVDEAKALFDILPERNVVTYNAMLSGYVNCERLNEAYVFFQEMPVKNVVSWTSMLSGFLTCGMIEEGKRLFQEMPERNVVTWNSMVYGLVKNGDLEGARSTFDVMQVRDVVSWNVMIDGYVESGMMEEAGALFELMEDKNVVTWTSLVAGYCRAGQVWTAYDLFRAMPEKNVVSWTAMISGFSWNGYYEEAIALFLEMRKAGRVKPNDETLVSLVYACAGVGFCRLGMQVHAHLITNGWDYHDDGRLSNSLVFMYSRFGRMDYAQCIFMNNSRNWTTQSCNVMINGYVEMGLVEMAQCIFDVVPMHDKISCTCMITGYLNAGEVTKAITLFNSMPEKDAMAWTAMISGYVQNELFLEAMSLFTEMLMQGTMPLQSTYAALLGVAGAIAQLDQGRQLHCLLIKTQTNFDLILENALISMYAKCGQIGDAHEIFSNMACRDVISWNSMIMGYAHYGLAHEALSLFVTMTGSKINPNSVTFLGIVSACSHVGLINEGCAIYRTMSENYGIQPEFEHSICMINLLGRAGKVNEAEEFVLNLPIEQGIEVWGSLLGVCGLTEGNTEIAQRTSKRLLELDSVNAPAHIVLCNMHAANGRYREGGILRSEMRSKGMRKLPGCSWISNGQKFHVFLSGDRPQS